MKQIIYRIIYNPFVNRILRNINKALSPLLPDSIKIPPSGIIAIKTFENKILRIKTNQSNYLTHLLFWKGYLNFEYTGIFIKLIRKVNVFYDIGANIGYYSLLAELENPNIKVVAFEPASGPLYYLNENIRLNNFKKILAEDIALSEKTGEITFYEIKNKKYRYLKHNLAGEGNIDGSTSGRNFEPVLVKTTTLNQYVSDNNEEKIDLVKMDTEGTENLILKHADIVLGQLKPIIICETLFNEIESELQSIFNQYGYEFYNHTQLGLEKVESIERETDNGVRNCFFVHPTKYYLIEEFII